MIREHHVAATPGLPVLLLLLAVDAAGIYWLITAVQSGSGLEILLSIGTILVATFLMAGLFVVNPNEAKVLQLFGAYAGTVNHWINRTDERVTPYAVAKPSISQTICGLYRPPTYVGTSVRPAEYTIALPSSDSASAVRTSG